MTISLLLKISLVYIKVNLLNLLHLLVLSKMSSDESEAEILSGTML